jgi:hypothetical protein
MLRRCWLLLLGPANLAFEYKKPAAKDAKVTRKTQKRKYKKASEF